KPRLELADERSRALCKPAEPGPGGEKNPGRTQGGTDHRAQRAKPGSEQEPAGNRQHGSARNRQGDQAGIGGDVEKGGNKSPPLNEAAQPIAVLGKRGKSQITVSSHRDKGDPCGDKEGERDQVPRRYPVLR